MILYKKSALSALTAAVLFSSASANASIAITLISDRLGTANGDPVVAGTLIQLVNLGGDGEFNPINLADGNVDSLGQWVSGDDSLVNLSFLVDGLAGDFTTAAAFDLKHSSSNETNTGFLSRVFTFASGSIPTNAKLGIRWFPGIAATQVQDGLVTLVGGERYGEFTRQSAPSHNGELWIITAADGSYPLDPLVTADKGGLDPVEAGNATHTVIVPEPTAIAMSLIGAAGLGMLRRRRA
jgi:hypothetical protein